MSVLALEILDRARQAEILVALAESCTGGMLASAITDVPGASDVFERGFVTYSNAAKRELLGVTLESLEAYGSVSESVAWEMAEGALAKSHAQIAVAVTGIAGPGGSDTKPEGRVCFALCVEGIGTRAHTMEFGALGRSAIRAASVEHGLRLILEGIHEIMAPPTED